MIKLKSEYLPLTLILFIPFLLVGFVLGLIFLSIHRGYLLANQVIEYLAKV